MNDLVARLREYEMAGVTALPRLCGEAAARIEALETALEDAIDTLESMDLLDNPLYGRIRAALDKDNGQ